MAMRIPGFRLGIVGGGQLGRMMAVEARRLGVHTVVLDPSSQPPAEGLADKAVQGSLQDAEAIRTLARCADVVTYEIEHINVKALYELEAQGTVFLPRPSVLETIQDKLRQKQFLVQNNLPVPGFHAVSIQQLSSYTPVAYPIVQKLRTGGYDGRGVTVLHSSADQILQGDSMFEDLVDIRAELAVLVARGIDGAIAVYPVAEMVFDPRAQICSSVLAPARIPEEIKRKAVDISVAAVQALDAVGIVAVELFWAVDGSVLINEIAPRPHNSGHWTIEGCITNQFEQHVRAVCGLPLGSTELLRPSVMVNLLGAPESSGYPILDGATEALSIPGLKIHWYQKQEVKSLRKMGHFTVTASTVEDALSLAGKAQEVLQVRGTGRLV